MTVNTFSAPNRIEVRSKPKSRSGFTIVEGFVCLCIIVVMLAILLPAVRLARERTHRTECKNNLKQIGMALHNYEETYKAFPPAYTVDADGKPLHSWRTLILPFIDQAALYDTIDLSKPWDDPANAKAHATYIPTYQCTLSNEVKSVRYMACVGSNRCLLATSGRKLSDITDNPAETLMVIEVEPESPVHWMNPVDADEDWFLNFGSKAKLVHKGGINGLFADGSVKFINADMPTSERLSLLTINDSKK